MKVIRDCFGRSVRLTDERFAHILQHLELTGMERRSAGSCRLPQRCASLVPMRPCSYFTSITQGRLLVGNGSVSW